MQFKYRGSIIELSLVGIHYPDYPIKNALTAKAVWKIAINGRKNSGTRTGDRKEVLDKVKKAIDLHLSDPNIKDEF